MRAVLYMAALTATRRRSPFRAFYDQLTARGRPKKVALVAVNRKLSRSSTPFSGITRHGALEALDAEHSRSVDEMRFHGNHEGRARPILFHRPTGPLYLSRTESDGGR